MLFRSKKKQTKNFAFINNQGSKYEVLWSKPNSYHYGEADGTCASPAEDNPKIHINPYLTKQSELNTIIHEFTHAFFWDATEQEVYKFANTLSRFLYNDQKWRKLRKGQYKKGVVYKSKVLEKEKQKKNEKRTLKKSSRRPKKRSKRNRRQVSSRNKRKQRKR